MVDVLKCGNCSKPYRFDKLRECPSCGNPTPESYDASQDISSKSFGSSEPDEDPLSRLNEYSSVSNSLKPTKKDKDNFQQIRSSGEAKLADLVIQQKRTTHAVRSLAKFFIYNFVWSTVSVIIFAIAFYMPRDITCGIYSCSASNFNGFAIFLCVISGLVALIGVCVTAAASLDELNNS